jgi:hypothetical protein
MATTPDERAERRQTVLTRGAITAIVRAAIDEGIASYRRQYAVQGYNLETWLAEITKHTTTELELLLYEAIVRKGKHPAWPAMVTVVEATHRPSSYVKDFYYHDREALEQKQPRTFAWTTRDTGTWLFVPGTGRDSCLGLARAAQGSGQGQDWYWWNGQMLARVDAQTALARVVAAERALARREKEEAVRSSS